MTPDLTQIAAAAVLVALIFAVAVLHRRYPR